MLAWLQRGWVALLMAMAALVAVEVVNAGLPWWVAGLIVLLVLNVHAWFLAFEFALLSRVDPGETVPRPRPSALVRAWWGEVRTGLLTFCWRQPFRSRRWPDRLDSRARARRGLLLVHGFVCNRGLWNPWLERLTAADVPFIAVNLEPVIGPIERYVEAIDAAVHRLEVATGNKPLIIAHSMGGLAVRAWLRDCRAESRVHSIVTIGTPHGGTQLARLAVTPNARQMRPGNAWLRALDAAETPTQRGLFTCFFSHCDNIVFPAASAILRGADNRHVEGVAHVHLAFEGRIVDEVLRRLEADQTPSAAGASVADQL